MADSTTGGDSGAPDEEPVGLVPAAGTGSRLGRLGFSKELLPVHRGRDGSGTAGAPRPACECLLRAMRGADIRTVYMVLRSGKWDIPARLGDGSRLGIHLAYLMMGRPDGPPYTLDQAYPFVRERTVAFGFPDILFEPPDPFERLLRRRREEEADVVLGLFPAARGRPSDRVALEADGRRVRAVRAVADDTGDGVTWGVAVWSAAFTDFLHRWVAERSDEEEREPKVGDVFQAALEAGMRVSGLPVSPEPFLDIGVPAGLREAYRRLGSGWDAARGAGS